MSMTWWGNKRWLWTRIDCVDGLFWMEDYGKVFIWNFLDLESGNSFVTFKNGFNEPQWYILKYPLSYLPKAPLESLFNILRLPQSQKVPTITSFSYLALYNWFVCKCKMKYLWKISYPLQGRWGILLRYSTVIFVFYPTWNLKTNLKEHFPKYIPSRRTYKFDKYRTSQGWNSNSLLVNLYIFHVCLCMHRYVISVVFLKLIRCWFNIILQFLRSLNIERIKCRHRPTITQEQTGTDK